MGQIIIQEIAGPRIIISGEGAPSVTIADRPEQRIVISAEGVQGPAADGGGGQQVFVQPDAPTATGPYVWFQTGLAPSGDGFTLWFEDGL